MPEENIIDVSCPRSLSMSRFGQRYPSTSVHSIDSVMLLEKGFDVISTDGSDAMLRTAFAERWERRKEAAFDKWGKFSMTLLIT